MQVGGETINADFEPAHRKRYAERLLTRFYSTGVVVNVVGVMLRRL